LPRRDADRNGRTVTNVVNSGELGATTVYGRTRKGHSSVVPPPTGGAL
jgi:urocanate hydratase